MNVAFFVARNRILAVVLNDSTRQACFKSPGESIERLDYVVTEAPAEATDASWFFAHSRFESGEIQVDLATIEPAPQEG